MEDALAGIHVSNATTKESLEAEIREAVKKALEAAGISGDVDISVENFPGGCPAPLPTRWPQSGHRWRRR